MKKNVTIHYGIITGTYSVGYVTLSAFSSVYLLSIGLSNSGVGMLLSAAALLSVLLQPTTGAIIDRSRTISSKSVLFFFSILILAIGILLQIFPGAGLTVKTLLYGIAVMFLMLGQPFLNSLGTEAINQHYPMNLGVGRSIGSLGYALGSYAIGFISVAAGAKSIPLVFSLAFFVLCFLLWLYPVKTDGREDACAAEGETAEDAKLAISEENAEKPKKDAADRSTATPMAFMRRYPGFLLLMFALILIYFSHCLINTFALQIVQPKGGDSGSMGTASAIAAGCELITAFFFVQYRKLFKIQTILKISGVFFTLKTLGSLLAGSVVTFYLVQALQMFGWGFMTVGIIYYVNELVGIEDKAQGQAYAGMAFTIGSVLATFLGGNIIDAFGVNTMLAAGTVSAAVGTALLWKTVK